MNAVQHLEGVAPTSVTATSVTAAPVLYVLKRFPRLSETFILREILGLEAAGVRVLVDDSDGFTTKHLIHAHCSRRLAGAVVRGLRKT